jgi:cytochrome P450
MRSPQCSGALARLRDEFGVESPKTIDNVIVLMFAGFDTTGSTLTYMLSLLADHPDVLEKVRERERLYRHVGVWVSV